MEIVYVEFVSDISFTVLSIEFFNMARYMGMQGFGMDKMKNTAKGLIECCNVLTPKEKIPFLSFFVFFYVFI